MSAQNPNAGFHPYVYELQKQWGNVESVLMLGLGSGMIPKDWLKHAPKLKTFDAIEINPVVVKAAQRWFALPNDDRLHVIIDDGAHYIAHTTKVYDLVIVDAYNAEDSIPEEFLTGKFFVDLNKVVASTVVLDLGNNEEGAKMERALSKVFASTRTVLLEGGNVKLVFGTK